MIPGMPGGRQFAVWLSSGLLASSAALFAAYSGVSDGPPPRPAPAPPPPLRAGGAWRRAPPRRDCRQPLGSRRRRATGASAAATAARFPDAVEVRQPGQRGPVGRSRRLRRGALRERQRTEARCQRDRDESDARSAGALHRDFASTGRRITRHGSRSPTQSRTADEAENAAAFSPLGRRGAHRSREREESLLL